MKSIKIYLQITLIFFSLEVFLISPLVAQEENLNVLEDWVEWSNGANMLPLHLGEQAYKLLDRREQEISLLKDEKDWLARQKKVKGLLMDAVGPFPEKSPLNPKVTGVIYRDGYRVEKIIYESLPGLYVTSCLFIPEGVQGKRPAILYASGHSDIAFRSETYQHIIINLVKKGFIVFATDPFGQGERIQYYDPEKKASSIGNSSSEHTYVGNQCLISGVTTARYSVWDCIRAIDYLCTRKEVDTERIGMTGRSGGGMQTAYVCAFDERLAAAAPECYITSFRRLFESIMPQDAEQNFFHGIAYGIDHADLLEVRAPRPTLIIATTRDFFSIQGARETYAEVKKAYKAFGVEDNLRMTEDDNVHKSTKKNREAMYAFFQETLNLPGSSADEDVEIMDEKELFVTPTG
ncbi:MAG: prolyl oligopeptidase family serine peptidase, partial [Chlorobi bacterium]|nr:prolyl oligopeptidase family serine peptidase [Chlorobiota bacterium]